jgi:hypothetical protein
MPKLILETPRLAFREMTRDEAAGWIDRQVDRYRSHGHGLWLVSDRESGEPAASGVRDYAFGTLGRARVVSLFRPENVPSQGVATRIGMVREAGRLVENAGHAHWVLAIDRR